MSRLRRLIGLAAGALVVIAASDARLFACPICFRFDESPVTHGIVAAVVTLVVITSVVLTGCGVFFGRLLKAENGTRNAERGTRNG